MHVISYHFPILHLSYQLGNAVRSWADQTAGPTAQARNQLSSFPPPVTGGFSSSQLLFSTKPLGTSVSWFSLAEVGWYIQLLLWEQRDTQTENRIPLGQPEIIFLVFSLNILLAFHCTFLFGFVMLYSPCRWPEEFGRVDKARQKRHMKPRRKLTHTCLSSCFVSQRNHDR